MSTPISICRVWKAAKGDEAEFEQLVKDVIRNREFGSYSIFPCDHNPSCKSPTEEEAKKFEDQMNKALKEHKQNEGETSK